jgi:hypothetical protein
MPNIDYDHGKLHLYIGLNIFDVFGNYKAKMKTE